MDVLPVAHSTLTYVLVVEGTPGARTQPGAAFY